MASVSIVDRWLHPRSMCIKRFIHIRRWETWKKLNITIGRLRLQLVVYCEFRDFKNIDSLSAATHYPGSSSATADSSCGSLYCYLDGHEFICKCISVSYSKPVDDSRYAMLRSSRTHYIHFVLGSSIQQMSFWISFGVLNIITEVALIAIPIHAIWDLKIRRGRKLVVMGCFASRSL